MEMRGIPHPDLDDPTLILSTVMSDLSTPLVNLQLELNPLDSEFDLDVSASLRPLQITYDAVSDICCFTRYFCLLFFVISTLYQ